MIETMASPKVNGRMQIEGEALGVRQLAAAFAVFRARNESGSKLPHSKALSGRAYRK